MSDSPSVPQKKPARPLNRWGVGTLSVLQTALLTVIVIAANYLAVNHYARLDLSRAVDYSLSPSTKRYVKSDTVRGREKPVKWIMAYRRSSPFYERSRAFAEEYARLSKGKIELEVVDPLRSPDRMQEITAAYGISLVRDLLIIDARIDDSPAVTEDANRVKTLNPHIRLVIAEDMAVYATAEGKRKIVGYQGEDVLTASLVGAIEGQARKMALLADKSRLEATEGPSPRKSLEDLLRFQNVALVELQVSAIDKIPEDVSGVVIAAPKYDLTESELAVLETYWNRPRAAILVIADSAGVPPKLRAFLRANGVTPRNDRVIAREKNVLVTAARGVFTKGVLFTRDLSGQATEFGGASASLEVREGAEDLLNRRIQPMGLIQVPAGFWGETKFGKGGEAYDEMEDHAPPMYLAASVTRGAESDDRFAADSSRMTVISNTDFLDPAHHRAENLDFLTCSVNWMIGREQLAGIGPRSLDTYKLPLLDAQVSFINRINLFFLPAFLLLIGAFVWSSRRV
jgi:hypothetical protein